MEQTGDDAIYIIDAYALIFRSYFAFISRPLTNDRGQNVSALFGFFKTLLSLIDRFNPSFLAAAFDSRVPTFRHKMYKEYKATRPKAPEDLHAQVPWIEEALRALGASVLRADGFEADDVIATVAEKARAQGRQCRIISGDKDLAQLVCPTTKILKTNQASEWMTVGAEGVEEEWGVGPEKMLDLLSLAGDSADNVPGVSGVGAKTACKYIKLYGSLDGIYENVDSIPGAIGKKFKDGEESARFSRTLIALRTDVPCAKTLEDAIPRAAFDYGAAARVLSAYGVPSVAKTLAARAGGGGEKKADGGDLFGGGEKKSEARESEEGAEDAAFSLKKNEGDYRALKSSEELRAFIDEALESEEKEIAFDCETSSLDSIHANIIGFSLCSREGHGVYAALESSDPLFSERLLPKKEALAEIERLFNDSRATVVMHNGKFDFEALRAEGVLFGSADFPKPACRVADTMVAAWALESDRTGKAPYSLEALAESKLRVAGTEFNDIVPKGGTFADVPIDAAAAYCAEDSDFTLRLWHVLKKELERENLMPLFSDIEMRLLPILAEMEIRGIHLDASALASYSVELSREIESIEKEIYSLVGREFNIASTKQLQQVLFVERGLKGTKKIKSGFSTDTSALEELSALDPVPRKILEYREKAKLVSTYVDTLPKLCDKNSRVHTSFVQTGTATGRLSSRDPNLQNIPVRSEDGRRIREAFTAEEGALLVSADYAQIELVTLAHLSGDENMAAAFKNGVDVHKATAAMIFGVDEGSVTAEQRRAAKTINFGVIYGMSAFRLASELCISRGDAAAFIENYFRAYPKIELFKKSVIETAERTGFVETIFGRRRRIREINSRNKVEKAAAERAAVNTVVQGSAADIVKKSMIDLDQALRGSGSKARLLLQVHDELILECPDEKSAVDETVKITREKMEGAAALRVPLRVSIETGKNWGEFH